MNRILEPGKEQPVLGWRLLAMAMVIAFFMGIGFLALLRKFAELVWG